MKNFVSIFVLSMIACSANAANGARPAMYGKNIMTAPRYTASKNQINGMNAVTNGKEVKAKEPEKDMREAERIACVNNNIGVGNTFVWASRLSDTNNYASMVEDVDNPQNNVCFVRVELKSDNNSRIDVSDISGKYFMWGETIDCGSWVNKDDMEKRILDARKGARIGGIVASSVGGAGLGVGAMEWFGNKLIDGKVQGQKSKKLSETEIYRSQLLVYKKENKEKYNAIVGALKVIKDENYQGNIGDVKYDTYKELIKEFTE